MPALIGYLVLKDRGPFVRAHTATALNFQLTLLIAYVVGGILIGPFTPGPSVTDLHTFEVFAEIGVILLMFSIGVEFSLRDLLRVKWVAIAGAPIGVLVSIGLGMAAADAGERTPP